VALSAFGTNVFKYSVQMCGRRLKDSKNRRIRSMFRTVVSFFVNNNFMMIIIDMLNCVPDSQSHSLCVSV
jgi:hypothetical protein